MGVIGSPVNGGGASTQSIGLGWADYADTEFTSGSPFSLAANTDTLLPNNGQGGVTAYQPVDNSEPLFRPSYVAVSGITGTFQVGETITGGTSSDTARITVIDTAAGRLYVDQLNGDFQAAETITGGTSGATATVAATRVGAKITGIQGESRIITLNCNVLPTNAGTTYIEFWFDIGGAVGELYRRIVSFPKGNGVLRPVTLSTAVYTLDTWEANGADVYVRANGTADIYDVRYVINRLTKVT